MISFLCHNCDTKLSADSSLYGSTVNCPACDTLIKVPMFIAEADEPSPDHAEGLNQIIKMLRKDLSAKSAELSHIKEKISEVKETERKAQAAFDRQRQQNILDHEKSSAEDKALIKELQGVIQKLNEKVLNFEKRGLADSSNLIDQQENQKGADPTQLNDSNEQLIARLRMELEVAQNRCSKLAAENEMLENLQKPTALRDGNYSNSMDSNPKKRNIFSAMRERKQNK